MHISQEISERVNSISAWAKGLPESAWTPGIPPQSTEGYCAIKTESGAILGGRLAPSVPNSLPVGKHGKIIAYILVGEQSHPDLWENCRADST